MQLAPSLHRLGPGMVNSYLVEDGGGVTIIDAGLPGDWNALRDELAAMGRSLDDVRGLVLTHGDTDHIGFAARLSREAHVPIFVHELDAPRARAEVKKPTGGWGSVKVRPLLGFLAYSARRGGLRIPPATDLTPLAGDTTLDLPGAPRIIQVPGHTPGSVAVHVPAVSALFVGDALTTRNVLTGETGPRLAPFTLEPAQALASLDRLAGIGGCSRVTATRGRAASRRRSGSSGNAPRRAASRRPRRRLPPGRGRPAPTTLRGATVAGCPSRDATSPTRSSCPGSTWARPTGS
jgi:glyoxylase-like metal-dependent hydrolase (beta-lactamase superfamily II)